MAYTDLTRHLLLPAGERPASLTAEFTEDDGETLLDLTGFSGELAWVRHADGANGIEAAAIDGPLATVTASLPDALMDNPGIYEAALWALGPGGEPKYASTWRIVIVPALGTTTLV